MFGRSTGGLTVLRSASPPACHERVGGISFLVRSDGTTGEEWVERLLAGGFRVGRYARDLLRSPRFVSTTGVTTRVAVLKGALFEDGNRFTENIRDEAAQRGLLTPTAEVACLIREKFTDEEIKTMGLWFVATMHEPINDSDGDSDLLIAHRGGDGRWLSAYSQRAEVRWRRDSGFAFAVATYRLV